MGTCFPILSVVFFIVFFLFALTHVFAQTSESGSAFNRFMEPQAGVNLLSGTVAFSKPLTQISSGGVSTSFDLAYSSNVFREVQSRNDRSPGSWVGLGWALGRAMILCDHRGTMPADDDSYSLVLPTGVRYQFVRGNNGKWWIEQQPYWQVEQITKPAVFSGKSYTIVVGWKIINESGFISYYGDYADNPLNPKRNATQHDLSWPYDHGLVGYAIGGNTALHPNAWNLSRQEDLEGNWLEYDYEQIFEKISVRNWTSNHGYTKESYLKEVRSSAGSSIKLLLEDKGQGEYHGEYWDSRGLELPGSPPNAFINPLERKYLSAIEVFGADGMKTGRIDLCYKALKIRPGGKDAEGYTKRLLVSVIHTDANGIEVDREDYDYYTEAERASASTIEGARREPLGALYRVRGPNCGSVDYTYSHFSLGKAGIEGHAQTIDIGSKHLQMGYLSDGTQYLVGMDGTGKVSAYGLVGGLWIDMPVLFGETFNASKASIVMGDKGWFAISHTEGSDGQSIIPVVWDSEKWVVGSTIPSNGSRETVWSGPDYLLHLRASNNRIALSIPWSRWGKTYNYTIPNVDDSKWDRKEIKVSAGRNHILVTYIRDDVFTPNSKAITVLTFSGDSLVRTAFLDDLDNDNQYYMWGDYFYGLEEKRGLVGYRSSAWHWNGNEWKKLLSGEKLNGWQGNLSLEASGADYYVVLHNDNDDLTLFDWDGEYWHRPYKNKNMVDNDDFDLFVESRWRGVNGNDFFIARHPRNTWKTVRVCLIARPKMWGLKCVLHVDLPYWQSTDHHARITRFEKRDGEWSSTSPSLLGCPTTEKRVVTGQDWYTESACANKAWIWNSQTWREESISNEALKNAESLGGGFFYQKQGNNDTQVKIYRKLDDSFVNPFGAFVVTEKKVSDPVTDKTHKYLYDSYTFESSSDGTYAFDGPNNTPLVSKVSITLPENAGILHQTMCNPRKNNRVGMGQVCIEENFDTQSKSVGKTEYTYERFRGANWPREIYTDRLESVKGVSGGIRSEKTLSYSELNGMPFKVVEVLGNKKMETRTVYAAENYNALKNANRLSEVAASYACLPSCDADGKITQASSVRYGTVSGATIPYAMESWNWEPETVQAGNSFSFNWNSSTQSSHWKKVNTVTRFDRGRAVENVDRLGHFSASFHESNKVALPYGRVFGSKWGATLLIPGESCEIPGLTACKPIKLQGNATKGSGLGYGRFSDNALLSPVTANLAASAGGIYRFSAWIQGMDLVNRTLQLSLNGQTVREWTIVGADMGKWQRIQWEGSLPTGTVSVALSALGSEIRVQDIRLQPYEALSSVTFWDRRQGIPLVQVDERGVGSYAELDAAGRIKARYMEDEQGNVFLSQQLTYAAANCRENGQGANRLAGLKINEISVPLPSIGGEQTYILPDGEREFSIKWTLFQERDRIRYQLYPEGQEATAEWISACCGEIETAIGDATVQKNWVLRLDVEPFSGNNQADYTIRIRKDATGWTDHGGLPSSGVGTSGRYMGNHESGRLIFIDHTNSKILQEANFDGNGWQLTALGNVRPEEFHVAGRGNSRYFAYLPINSGEESGELHVSMFGNTGHGWSEYGALAEKGDVDLLRSTVDGNQGPWAIYRHARTENDPGSLQAVRWNAGQNLWEKAGSLPIFGNDSAGPTDFLQGRISERLPEDADIVLGLDGNMYVAYIGSITSLSRDPSVPLNRDSAAPRVVVIKRLYNATESRVEREIWAGPSLLEEEGALVSGTIPEYDGDILVFNDTTVLFGARRVRIASDGEHLYLAVAYAVETDTDGMLAVSVFKGTRRHLVTKENVEYRSKLVFEPLIDTSVLGSALGAPLEDERIRALYIKPSESFDFVVRQGTPYLAFANSANRQNLTVIYHTGSRWLSVGNPAFAPLAADIEQLSLSVDAQKKPYVVYKEGMKSKNTRRRNRIVPLKYVETGDRDLTLNAVGFSGAVTSLPSEFRQYILNYQASFAATATGLKISPAPRTISDIVGIQVENNNSLISSWIISPNSSEAGLYMSGVTANYSGTSIPAIDIPLAEGLNVVSVKIFGKNGKQLLYTFELSREFLPDPGFGVSGGEEGPACVWFSTGWSLKCGNNIFYVNTCFEEILSKPLECELSNRDTTIVVVIPGGDEDDDGGGGGGGGGGDDGILPPELRPFSNYSLFASINLNLADRVIMERGHIAAHNKIEVGADSELRFGDLISGGDVWLRSRAKVQAVILSGNLDVQQGATYTSVEQKSVDLPVLPVLVVTPGTEHKTIGNDQQVSIEPGRYGNFHAYSRSVVSFAPGDYYFSSFILEPDVKLEFGTSERGVRIWVQGELRLADRVVLENFGTPEKLLLYTNSSNNIRLGTDNVLRATVVAPAGTVEIPSRMTFTNHIWAKNIIVQPDVDFQ